MAPACAVCYPEILFRKKNTPCHLANAFQLSAYEIETPTRAGDYLLGHV